ncbi:uncharacterized protein LOC126734243 [Anthonomus grandis grandis]|uniref:uncharacterized protein LOC126734243 n=1 Tax=Anthonomus grandis grandis TaxID=2921223 RepID=UPI0021665F47|nr:uncharacterized protein LOC126734243 [Anthonomus grandis grandis]
MYPRKHVRRCALFCGFSALLVVLGIVIICFRTFIYKSILSKIFVLNPGSYIYDVWRKNPIPMSLDLYLFNWTNPEDVLNGTSKPILQELGPYSFDETKEKVNLTWNSNNTVSFYHLKKWWFNSERSNGTLHDPVTSVNPIALSTALAAKSWHAVIKRGINIFFRSLDVNVYGTHTAGECLFDGYKDPLLSMANHLPVQLSNAPNYDKFGWFYTRNNSEKFEGQFNMDTGHTGQLGELYSWKFMNQTPYFSNKCGKVGGSAGEFFPSDLRKESLIKFFSADLCRFVQLEFEKEVIVSGVVGYKYTAQDRFLDNGTKIPENKCFCGNEQCQPYGVLDISACRYGSPAYVSLPHFNKADPYYTSLLEGVKPVKDRHDFFMIFEPKTGLPLQVSARLQVNLLMQSVPGVGVFSKVPRVYMPILWFEQNVLIPEDLIFYLRILSNFENICLAVGIICILSSILLESCYCYRICTTKVINRKQHVITRGDPIEEIPLKHKEKNGFLTKTKNGCLRQCGEVSMLICGICLTAMGLGIFLFLENIYDLIINDALKFTNNSEAFKAWKSSDPPLDLDLYLFNWTNVDKVLDPNVKPHFEECGPYRVKEVTEKTNLIWNSNNTITYQKKKIYFYDDDYSPKKLNEVIKTINPVALTVAYKARELWAGAKLTVSFMLAAKLGTDISITTTARKIILDGYEDKILDSLSSIPVININKKFGYFHGRNNTVAKGTYSMYTKNDENFGKQMEWDYKNTTNFYEGRCNEIKGSATEFYPLNIKKSEKLVFYSPELCKYAELEFVREETIKGVLGYRFSANNIFDNGTLYPENRCFCGEHCYPSGVLDVSKCRDNSPTFLSFPHFYAADPYYTNLISGMKPDAKKHEFYLIIEPKTGIIMNLQANMQVNMLLQPINRIRLFSKVPKIFVPMFYFSQFVDLDDNLAANLKLLQRLPDLLNYVSLICIGLGLIVIVWGACVIFKVCKPKAPKQKSFEEEFMEEIPINEKNVKICR